MDDFLNFVGKYINRNRIPLPDNIGFSVDYRKDTKSYAAIWIKTIGCRYSYGGGCTMCDYFIGSRQAPDEIYANFVKAAKTIKRPIDLIVMNTSGSFFDTNEIPENTRIKIFSYLKEEFPDTVFVFETHVSTIDEYTINQCLSYFDAEKVQIQMGVEVADEWIRKYCVNKNIKNDLIKEKVKMLNKKRVHTILNFILGIPFLSRREGIDYAKKSIEWAFLIGASRVTLFPINIKPYTLVQWLYKNGLYTPVSLWDLVEVLDSVRAPYLNRVEINWYHQRPYMSNPNYEEKIIGPYTCDNCNEQVVQLLNNYFLNPENRRNVLNELNAIQCKCKGDREKSIVLESIDPIKGRIKKYFSLINEMVLNNGYELCFDDGEEAEDNGLHGNYLQNNS